MELYINTLLISKIHIPIHAGLLGVNATLFLNSLFCCLQVLHRFYFLSFLLFFHAQHCSLIYTTLFHLSIHFSILFFVLDSIYCFNHWDWLDSKTRCTFFVLILASSKASSFYDESHIFLYLKSLTLIFWHCQ